MTSTPSADNFGFKRLTQGNWLTPDPVWKHFAHSPTTDPATAWMQEILRHDLAPTVPVAIRKLFEVARGSLAYGYLFYPLLTLGTEQIFRVLEGAITNKCSALNAPVNKSRFFDKIYRDSAGTRTNCLPRARIGTLLAA